MLKLGWHAQDAVSAGFSQLRYGSLNKILLKL
jgi:hypothetical protein